MNTRNVPIRLEKMAKENGVRNEKNLSCCNGSSSSFITRNRCFPFFSRNFMVKYSWCWLLGFLFCVACGSNEEEIVPPIPASTLFPPLNVSEASPQTALRVLLNEELPGTSESLDTNTVIRMPQKVFSEEDIAKVLPALRRAAEGGMPNAQYILGMCDYLGRGTTHNAQEAFDWFQKAADQNEPQSQCMLGVCYYYGQGVASDAEKAFDWFQKAADQDLVLAQFCLGICYYDGMGVAQDRSLALKCFRQAADRGHPQALLMVSTFSNDETKSDVASTQPVLVP